LSTTSSAVGAAATRTCAATGVRIESGAGALWNANNVMMSINMASSCGRTASCGDSTTGILRG
jgi:hypothetical protein